MQQRPLGRTGLQIAPIVFGGNVFGWTADEATSASRCSTPSSTPGFNLHRHRRRLFRAGCPATRAASRRRIIGRLAAGQPRQAPAGARSLTKVGMRHGRRTHKGLAPGCWIERAVEDSLRRLQHRRDRPVPGAHGTTRRRRYEETLDAFAELIKAGKVRAIGCLELRAPRQLAEAQTQRRINGLPRLPDAAAATTISWSAKGYEKDPERPVVKASSRASASSPILAGWGFLTGKYRAGPASARPGRGWRGVSNERARSRLLPR